MMAWALTDFLTKLAQAFAMAHVSSIETRTHGEANAALGSIACNALYTGWRYELRERDHQRVS